MQSMYLLRAYLTYTVFDLGLRWLGYERILRFSASPRQPRRLRFAATEAANETLDRVDQALGFVRRFYVIRRKAKDCLPRAFTVFHLLRREGLPASLFIGVKKFPFSAHSWVECEGRIVADSPAVCRQYKVLKHIEV
jgi:hypothetical protein